MKRVLTLVTLIIAGEMIFALPFQLPRFFRPTLLEVYALSNTELGDFFAAYGILAMLSYFPGGLLADRFPARTLLTASMLATAAGGIVLYTSGGSGRLLVLYGYWGITSILLFWGALIRATREWGGQRSQGFAFGALDAGRGLVAAIMASIGAWLFAALIGERELTAALRSAAFDRIILLYVMATFAVAALTWLFVPVADASRRATETTLARVRDAIVRPGVGAQAGIIIAAYCGFKGLDNYSLYAVQVLDYSETEAATLSAWGGFLRPVGALCAGLLADRFRPSRVVLFAFAAALVSYTVMAFAGPRLVPAAWLLLNLAVSYLAVCGLRGVYFALIGEQSIPPSQTGTVVGIVSLVGFTPDIFFAPIAGRILDANPGLTGHQHYFLMLVATAVLGLLMTVWLLRSLSLQGDAAIEVADRR